MIVEKIYFLNKMEPRSFPEILEIILNTLNHIFIGICMFYNFYYWTLIGYDIYTWHEICCSIGFHLLMAEGILTMYNRNTFTLFVPRTKNKWIHAFLQATGGAFGLTGFFIEIYKQLEYNKPLFDIWHGIFGEFM